MSARPVDELLAEADARWNVGEGRTAARLYQEAILRAPHRAEGFVGLARMLAGQRRAQEAMTLLRDAVAADPSHVPSYALAGRIGLRFGQTTLAHRLLQAGVLAHSDSAVVCVWLARLQATLAQLTPLRQTLRHLEDLTHLSRAELVRELLADDDMGDQARASLRRVSGLQVA